MLNRNLKGLENKLASFLKREMEYKEVDKKNLTVCDRMVISQTNKGFMSSLYGNIHVYIPIVQIRKVKTFLDKREVNYKIMNFSFDKGYKNIYINER